MKIHTRYRCHPLLPTITAGRWTFPQRPAPRTHPPQALGQHHQLAIAMPHPFPQFSSEFSDSASRAHPSCPHTTNRPHRPTQPSHQGGHLGVVMAAAALYPGPPLVASWPLWPGRGGRGVVCAVPAQCPYPGRCVAAGRDEARPDAPRGAPQRCCVSAPRRVRRT